MNERIANDPAVVQFAQSGFGKAQALAVLEKTESARDTSRVRAQIISPAGAVLLDRIWRPAPTTPWTLTQILSGAAAGTDVLIGPIDNADGRAAVTTIAAIRGAISGGARNAPLAYLVETRALSGSGQDVIGKLIGKQVTFLVGQNSPAVWTDLNKIVPGPPCRNQCRTDVSSSKNLLADRESGIPRRFPARRGRFGFNSRRRASLLP